MLEMVGATFSSYGTGRRQTIGTAREFEGVRSGEGT